MANVNEESLASNSRTGRSFVVVQRLQSAVPDMENGAKIVRTVNLPFTSELRTIKFQS